MPSQSAKAQNYAFGPLQPKQNADSARVELVNLQPSLTSTSLVAGAVLANITSSANDVQTVTFTGSPSGGSVTLSGTNPITDLNFVVSLAQGATAAAFQASLTATAAFGASNITVSGSSGGPYTVTGAGALTNMPIPILALASNSLTGGSNPSLTIAHTTVGRTAGTYGLYNSAVAAPPTVPVLTGTGTSGSTGSGDFIVCLTGVNAQGETTPSPSALVTLTSTQSIHVAAITSLDTSFTALNVYVDGLYVGQCTCSAGTSTATTFNEVISAVTKSFPAVNTAYTIPNGAGCQTAVSLLIYTCQTDATGAISYSTTNATGEWGQTDAAAATYVSGTFDVSQITGLDAKAVKDLGRLRWGTTSVGELQLI